jgi:hypothetical protein
VRNASDYDDFYIVSREDVDLQIDKAIQFIISIGEYLAAQGVRIPERWLRKTMKCTLVPP